MTTYPFFGEANIPRGDAEAQRNPTSFAGVVFGDNAGSLRASASPRANNSLEVWIAPACPSQIFLNHA